MNKFNYETLDWDTIEKQTRRQVSGQVREHVGWQIWEQIRIIF